MMAAAEDEDEDGERKLYAGPVTYSVSGPERDLLLRGLQTLKLKILDEASRFALEKLSRRSGGLTGKIDEGNQRLREVDEINALYKRLTSAGGSTLPKGGKSKTP